MEVKTTKNTIVSFNEDEANWLRNIMQNALNDKGDPGIEGSIDRKHRLALFEALGGNYIRGTHESNFKKGC